MAIERALCPVLVGRDEQLTTLEDALLAAYRGEGQIVVLAGEAGIGKTRLARELQRRALQRGATALWGGCSEADLSLPYLPFAEAIANYLAQADVKQLRQRLGTLTRELGHLFPQLQPEWDPRETGDDPMESKLRLFEALLALLRVPAEAGGLLVVLEDLHWADASTRELLDYFSRRVHTTRVLVLATCRTDELPRRHPLLPMLQGWRRTGVAQVVDLQPLPAAGVAEMVEAIFDQPVRREFRDFLYRRSDGNPFVLEELLKAALDRIRRTSTGWDLKVMTELSIPPTVQDTILLRVERLGEEQAEILRAAAVLGPAFTYPTLVAVCGRDSRTVQAALHTFVQQQLMEEEPSANERYRFRHALTREAIYEDLIGPKRAELHGRAADVLRGQAQTAPVDLAVHLLAANRWEEAVPVCLSAAEEAEHRSGYREAAELYGRVLPHVRDDCARGRILCRLGNALFFAGNPARAQAHLEEGTRLLEQCGETREAAGYRIKLGNCHAQRSRPELARAEWERARMTLEGQGPSEDLAYACVHLASQQGIQWETDAALALARHAVAVAEAAGAEAPRILAAGAIGLILARLGRIEEGLDAMDRSYADALNGGHEWIAGNALVNGIVARVEHFRAQDALPRLELLRALSLSGTQDFRAARAEGAIYSALGEPEKARQAWEIALELARERDAATFVRTAERGLAYANAALARFDDARNLLRPSDSLSERQLTLSDLRATIRILLDAGDLAGALEEAQRVLKSPDWGPLPGRRWMFDVAVEALLEAGQVAGAEQLVGESRGGKGADPGPYQIRMEARVALARGDLISARMRLENAAAFWQQAGYREEEARTRRALAEVLARQGDRARAEAELRGVVAYALAQGAVFEGACARRQLSELGVELEGDEHPPLADKETELRQASERLVTVMFVDVRGYTRMTEREAPEAMAERIATFHRWARQEIERHHGIVERYAGDAVMATFNVARARLDHCLLALQAAIAIRDRAAYVGLPVGVGIAVGPAVVGVLTDGAAMAALGSATNLAARLQAKASASELVLSAEAFRRTREWLKTQRMAAKRATLRLKGFLGPVVAYRLVAGTEAKRT